MPHLRYKNIFLTYMAKLTIPSSHGNLKLKITELSVQERTHDEMKPQSDAGNDVTRRHQTHNACCTFI